MARAEGSGQGWGQWPELGAVDRAGGSGRSWGFLLRTWSGLAVVWPRARRCPSEGLGGAE